MSDESESHEIRDSKSNESGELPSVPAKSPEKRNLRIASPQDLIDRLRAANRSARCRHVKSNGQRCGSPALRNGIFCYFHEIWRCCPIGHPHGPDPSGAVYKLPLLEDANGVQMALQQVLDSILANKMDLRRAQVLLYGLQTASANARHTHFNAMSDVTTELT